MKVSVIVAAVLSVAGCSANLAEVSSGRIGCAPSEITIADESSGWNASSWTAICNGKEYFCSAASGGWGAVDVDCKPRQQ
jgi:hypothetical protein